MTNVLFTPNDMLDNAACAAQSPTLDTDAVVRGAILRSIVQWIDLNPDMDRDGLRMSLITNSEFHQ